MLSKPHNQSKSNGQKNSKKKDTDAIFVSIIPNKDNLEIRKFILILAELSAN